MYENTATPNSKMKEHINLSKSLRGAKSPKPTVDSDVKLKYNDVRALC